MVFLLFLLAVLCMAIGHLFKVKRWGLFISVYETPSSENLLTAMTIGQTVNAILPVRLGDVFRVFWAGRKMGNGYSFAFATTAADLFTDICVVGCMFFSLAIMGRGGERLLGVAHFYMGVFALIAGLTIGGCVFKGGAKRFIGGTARIFNEELEFRILYVSFLCISSIKDIVRKIPRLKALFYTACIWGAYIASFIIFAEVVQQSGFYYTASDVVSTIFYGSSLYQIDKNLIILWGAYLIAPLGLCQIISRTISRGDRKEAVFRPTLPQLTKTGRLVFLKKYYASENRERLQLYLDFNSDAVVVEDKSAGSNASTLLIMNSAGNMFFRKYAFDEDGDKLRQQIYWLENHQSDIPLPLIAQQKSGRNYTVYDMYSYISAVGMFRFIHTSPVKDSWPILQHALDDIGEGLHTKNRRSADVESIERYIAQKVEKNLDVILSKDKYIIRLEQNDAITVNGASLPTLKFYRNTLLSRERLKKVFANDFYADIHGDLTIENIICLINDDEIDRQKYEGKVLPKTYYFIDPNADNIHESPFLDYGKLLQSLHGNYEFLTMVSDVRIDTNSVNYFTTRSDVYAKLYDLYRKYLTSKFSKDEVVSVYYHEIVHWLRLMPYKIRKNERLAVVFYTGLLSVLKDVWEMEHE